MGRTCAKVHATKSRRNLSQRTHPIHPIGPYTDVLVCSYYLGPFGTVWLPYETRYKTGRTSAKVRARMSRWNFSQRTHHWTLNWHFGACQTIWLHPRPFGCFTKLDAKRAELVQKFVPRSRVGIFLNECTRYTPLDPKLMFWCVSYYLGAVDAKINTLEFEGKCSQSTKSRPSVPVNLTWN